MATLTGTSDLTEFCHDMLMSLPRSDQRRWGEIYVRGLISVPGRKSVRGMSDHVVGGRADQGIQQFVNQSPWDWEPVRRSLAQRVISRYRPEAWVFDEVVLPKNGASSVAVARQYAPSAGRVMNCQLGVGAFLVGGAAAVPVDWRLLLPLEWDADLTRRARAHVPAVERHRTRWQSIIDIITEMTNEWELDPAPVVVDARHDTNVEPLLRAFDERGLHYVVRVAAGTPTVAGRDGALTAGDFAAVIGRNSAGTTSLNWRDDADRPAVTSRLVMQALPRQIGSDAAWWRNRQRHLLAEWVPDQQRPTGIWLTNLKSPRVPELIGLARANLRTQVEVARLQEDFGLGHFEGRSFRGWHHHVTLVSLAHAYTTLQRLGMADRMRTSA